MSFKNYSQLTIDLGDSTNGADCLNSSDVDNCTLTNQLDDGYSSEEQVIIIAYIVFLLIGGTGNLAVFVKLLVKRPSRSRFNVLLTHLAIADLLVTFILIPSEIGWRITQSWRGGELSCKVVQAARVFGSYLSSAVLICIGLDRYFAVVWPLGVQASYNRSTRMLIFSWFASACLSFPQVCISILFVDLIASEKYCCRGLKLELK